MHTANAPLAATAASLIVLATALPAQEPAEAVSRLLDKIEKTTGLVADAPRTLVIDGDYSVRFENSPEPVGKGAFREHFDGKSLGRHRSDMGEMGALERGYTGDLVWEVDPGMGARVYRAHNAAAVRRYCAVVAGRSPRELYENFERIGSERIDGRAHEVLRMSAACGRHDTWYVDADGRVARVATALPAPESSPAAAGIDDLMPSVLDLSDWRKVGTAMLPHRRELKMGPATITFVCRSIKVGNKLAAATFEPPKAVAKAAAATADAAPAFGPDGKPLYQVVSRERQPVASIRVRCKSSEVSKQLAILLPEVMSHLSASGGRIAGAPFSRYHGWDKDTVELEAGIPVKKAIEENGRIKNSSLPAGKAVACWHIGPYQGLSKARAGLLGYLRSNKLQQRGGAWEIYWTDPGMVPDSSKWRTQLFAPIK